MVPGYSHVALSELRCGGLPDKADVLMISVSEIWLPPPVKTESVPDSDLAEYFQKHTEQTKRNLAETKVIVCQARDELLRYFPDWNIKTQAVTGSLAREILARALEFKPDLIVVAARGLSSDQETGLGSISQKLLTAAKCSVRISRFKPEVIRSQLRIISVLMPRPTQCWQSKR